MEDTRGREGGGGEEENTTLKNNVVVLVIIHADLQMYCLRPFDKSGVQAGCGQDADYDCSSNATY